MHIGGQDRADLISQMARRHAAVMFFPQAWRAPPVMMMADVFADNDAIMFLQPNVAVMAVMMMMVMIIIPVIVMMVIPLITTLVPIIVAMFGGLRMSAAMRPRRRISLGGRRVTERACENDCRRRAENGLC